MPSVSGLNREKRPVAVTVSVKRGADEDAAWLPLDDYSRVVDYSRFPTQGQTSNADGINAYVFSERGIFRPGETLRFGMLMRPGRLEGVAARHALLRGTVRSLGTGRSCGGNSSSGPTALPS